MTTWIAATTENGAKKWNFINKLSIKQSQFGIIMWQEMENKILLVILLGFPPILSLYCRDWESPNALFLMPLLGGLLLDSAGNIARNWNVGGRMRRKQQYLLRDSAHVEWQCHLSCWSAPVWACRFPPKGWAVLCLCHLCVRLVPPAPFLLYLTVSPFQHLREQFSVRTVFLVCDERVLGFLTRHLGPEVRELVRNILYTTSSVLWLGFFVLHLGKVRSRGSQSPCAQCNHYVYCFSLEWSSVTDWRWQHGSQLWKLINLWIFVMEKSRHIQRRAQWHSVFTPAGFNNFKIKPTYTDTTHLPRPSSVIILKEKHNISSAFQHVTLNNIPILLLVSH